MAGNTLHSSVPMSSAYSITVTNVGPSSILLQEESFTSLSSRTAPTVPEPCLSGCADGMTATYLPTIHLLHRV